jgi:signal peptidase II
MRSVLTRSVQAAAVTLALDQGTKWLATATGRAVINPGGAFSLGWTQSSIVLWGSVAGLGLLFFSWPTTPRHDRVFVAFAIAAGVSNLVDRITFGGVRDFIDLPIPLDQFPVFNVADLILTLSLGLLLVQALVRPPQPVESR